MRYALPGAFFRICVTVGFTYRRFRTTLVFLLMFFCITLATAENVTLFLNKRNPQLIAASEYYIIICYYFICNLFASFPVGKAFHNTFSVPSWIPLFFMYSILSALYTAPMLRYCIFFLWEYFCNLFVFCSV